MRIDSQQYFTREFLPSLLEPILKRNRFDASIVVTPAASVAETRWLLDQAAPHEFIRGVVGWADLRDPEVVRQLDEYQLHPKFRGVRWWGVRQASRPVDLPDVLPPGLAEIALLILLGLLSGVVAVVCHWAVEARIDRAVLSR